MLGHSRSKLAGLYQTAREFLEAHEKCGDCVTKFSLLLLAMTAARNAATVVALLCNQHERKEIERNDDWIELSQKKTASSLLTTKEGKKFISWNSGERRVEFRREYSRIGRDFSEPRVPFLASRTASSPVMEDILLLEKEFQDICVTECFGPSLYIDESYDKRLQVYQKLRSINSEFGSSGRSFYISTNGLDLIFVVPSSLCEYSSNARNISHAKVILNESGLVVLNPTAGHQYGGKYETIPLTQVLQTTNFDQDLSQLVCDSLTRFLSQHPMKYPDFPRDRLENVLQLLRIVKRMCEGNEDLMKRNKTLEAFEVIKYKIIDKLEILKREHCEINNRLKAAILDSAQKYTHSSNPLIPGKFDDEDRCISCSNKTMSNSDRIIQLEKMVSGLLVRIEKEKISLNQKNKKIEVYEAYLTKMKNSLNNKSTIVVSSNSSSVETDSPKNIVLSHEMNRTITKYSLNSIISSRSRARSSATLTMESALNHVSNVTYDI